MLGIQISFEVYKLDDVYKSSKRIAKIKLDDWNFYGNNLHVFYAPEFETIDDVREKLKERREIVASKCQKYG